MHSRNDPYAFEITDDVRLLILAMSVNMDGLSLFVFVDGNFLFMFLAFLLHSELVRYNSVHYRLWSTRNLLSSNWLLYLNNRLLKDGKFLDSPIYKHTHKHKQNKANTHKHTHRQAYLSDNIISNQQSTPDNYQLSTINK